MSGLAIERDIFKMPMGSPETVVSKHLSACVFNYLGNRFGPGS
jgi:hypothetical protein